MPKPNAHIPRLFITLRKYKTKDIIYDILGAAFPNPIIKINYVFTLVPFTIEYLMMIVFWSF